MVAGTCHTAVAPQPHEDGSHWAHAKTAERSRKGGVGAVITVRYPSGFSIQYNGANYVEYAENRARLWESKDQNSIQANVLLSSGATIEFVQPCRTYDANSVSNDTLISSVMDRLRSLDCYRVAELKRALANFDAKRRRWKDESA
jgi:hypothetical protein